MSTDNIDRNPHLYGVNAHGATDWDNIIGSHGPASPESVDLILNAEVNDDGRSEWRWFRFPDGTLIFGCFPHGETFMEIMDLPETDPS